VGGALVGEILREAACLGRRVSLHVEPGNPAFAWYLRLGFVEKGDAGVYRFLEWSARPGAQPKISS
jgi:ribosomal protein S18 acetylase RimI-like enzyme